MVINIMSPWVKMPISWNFIEKYRGKKIQKDSKMGTKNIHDTFTHHTIPHLVSEFFISVATWKKKRKKLIQQLHVYLVWTEKRRKAKGRVEKERSGGREKREERREKWFCAMVVVLYMLQYVPSVEGSYFRQYHRTSK